MGMVGGFRGSDLPSSVGGMEEVLEKAIAEHFESDNYSNYDGINNEVMAKDLASALKDFIRKKVYEVEWCGVGDLDNVRKEDVLVALFNT